MLFINLGCVFKNSIFQYRALLLKSQNPVFLARVDKISTEEICYIISYITLTIRLLGWKNIKYRWIDTESTWLNQTLPDSLQCFIFSTGKYDQHSDSKFCGYILHQSGGTNKSAGNYVIWFTAKKIKLERKLGNVKMYVFMLKGAMCRGFACNIVHFSINTFKCRKGLMIPAKSVHYILRIFGRKYARVEIRECFSCVDRNSPEAIWRWNYNDWIYYAVSQNLRFHFNF